MRAQPTGAGRCRASALSLLGDALDPLGRRIEGGDHRVGGRLGAVGGDHARVLQGRDLLLQPADLCRALGQLVGDHQRRHHRQPGVADLAELARAARRCAASISCASACRCSSWPSSQARRNWRPAMVAFTCGHRDRPSTALARRAPTGSWRWPRRAARRFRGWSSPAGASARSRRRARRRAGRSTPSACTCAASASSLRSASRRRSTAASSASSAERQTLDRGVDGALLASSHCIRVQKTRCGGKRLGARTLRAARSCASTLGAAICPAVFARLCMARPRRRAVTLTQGPHMLSSPRKQAFSMSANASPTAAVAPADASRAAGSRRRA